MKIGVIPDCFRMPIKQAIKKSAELRFDGIQPYATKGELDPSNMTKTARDDFKKFVSDLGLEISAIVGDFGGHGFVDPKTLDWRVKRTKEVIDLAFELDVKVVTTHIGIVPEDSSAIEWQFLLQALPEIGSYAYQKGVFLATETGPEPVVILKKLLDKLNNPGIMVNYDPANLVMVAGDDPIKGVYTLQHYIVHTHAKDGIKMPDENQKKRWKEMPLGEGNVNFPEYLAAMKNIGYSGFFTIEREVGDNPESDIIKARDFLKELSKKMDY